MEKGNPQLANTCFEEALPLARAIQAPFVLPGVLLYMGIMHTSTGEFIQAEATIQEGAEIAHRLYAARWQAIGLWVAGHLAFLRDDMGKARSDLRLGLQLEGELHRGQTNAHIEEMLGRVEIVDQDLAGARARLTRSFTALQEQCLIPCLAHGLESWARLALAQGEPQRTVRILGAIDAHLKGLGMTMIPLEQALYDQTLAAVQQQLNATTFQQEWTAGEKLNLEQAIELAMR